MGYERTGTYYQQGHDVLILAGLKQQISHQQDCLRCIDVEYHSDVNLIIVPGLHVMEQSRQAQQEHNADGNRIGQRHACQCLP